METTAQQIARVITEVQRGKLTNDEWAEVWRWHTSPRTVAMGGSWENLRCAEAIVEYLNSAGMAVIRELPAPGSQAWFAEQERERIANAPGPFHGGGLGTIDQNAGNDLGPYRNLTGRYNI